MLTTASVAFKEWASVVEALATGEQILILRKGGIHEKGKKFNVEHESFFLFPTYEHQKEEDLNPRGQALLSKVRSQPPLTDATHVTFQYFAEAKESFWIDSFEKLLKLSAFHVWSENALRKRFTWGEEQGVFAIVVRIFQLPQSQALKNLPAYGGCRSWVELKEPLNLSGLQPVLIETAFQAKRNALHKSLS